jgi:hypothetical protein
MPAEETLTRCVVDTLARKFYCETPDQFMNVLEVVRAQVSDDCLAYSDPL